MGEFFSNINEQMNSLIYFKNKKNLEYNIQIREMNNNLKLPFKAQKSTS